jgi:undecaprenyl-diphosphatase
MNSNINALLKVDARLSARLRVETQGPLRWAAVFFAHSGDSWFWMAGLVLVWLFGAAEWHNRAAVLAISVVIQAVMVLSIKFLIRRRRPESDWGEIYRRTDPHSFPSGHATRAFLLATMAIGLGPAWFGLLLALWAPLVCLARVMLGVHYLSDILAGMVLGVLLGLLMLELAPLFYRIVPFLFVLVK